MQVPDPSTTNSLRTPWRPAPETLTLLRDEVHVWRASLQTTAARMDELYLTLAADERERAGRFHFRADRDHFVVARGSLRAILGRYLGIGPSQVRFRHGPYGKPELAGEDRISSIRFSVSHSSDLALYAVARGREVGVDLECIRPDLAGGEIAERFFSPLEVAALRALPDEQQPQAFFNCWTRKEAYVKARGEGLSLPLDRFHVSLVPGEPAALLSDEGDPQATEDWELQNLETGPCYAAALAVEGYGCWLTCWRWVV